ncbi:MAG: hypothetical protein ABR517_06490 [Thermoanaerobaculia bacterium]
MRLLIVALILLSQAGCLRLSPSLAGIKDLVDEPNWEYRYEVECHRPDTSASRVAAAQTDLLNRLGRDRWELVSVQPYEAASGSAERCWIFTLKRGT